MTKECWVYVIAPKTDDGYGAPTKVGISDNPGYRLLTFQAGSPLKLGIAYAFLFPDREIAMAVEQSILTVKKRHRIHGEWLDLPAHDVILSVACSIKAMLGTLSLTEEELEIALQKSHAASVFRALEGVRP